MNDFLRRESSMTSERLALSSSLISDVTSSLLICDKASCVAVLFGLPFSIIPCNAPSVLIPAVANGSLT